MLSSPAPCELSCSRATNEFSVTVVPDSVTVNAVASSVALPSLSYLPEIWLAESTTSVIAWLPSVVVSPVAGAPARESA
ncbi:hypothetical protein D9M72_615680 [compost metagenome]